MVNLIRDPWIPVVRADGTPDQIAPWQVTDQYDRNPVVGCDAARSDFNGALIQFLIGILQTALAPASGTPEWRRRLARPPPPEELRDAMLPFAGAFSVGGDGPRFMQDLTLDEGDFIQIDRLLMEMPGGNTLERNTDHFIKRDTVRALCPECAALALFTLQTNGPSGGSGHRTGLRGGGPLTTLVVGRTLWETAWLNVLDDAEFNPCGNPERAAPADAFPWLAPSRTSEANQMTTPHDVHPAQVFWAMPRRIRLEFESSGGPSVTCDLCGCATSEPVTRYQAKKHGVNYKGGWEHPLSPYSYDKKTGDPMARHAQPGGVTYRHWVALVQNLPERMGRPARVVQVFRELRQPKVKDLPVRLWAFGYDMDNMKARCWYDSTMPLVQVDEPIRLAYEATIMRLIRAAELVVSSTRTCTKKALFGENAPSGDFSFIDARFWQRTEEAFYEALARVIDALATGGDLTDIKREWLRTLTREANQLFDEYSQANLIDVADPKRIALAHRDLQRFTSPGNKLIREALDLPMPAASAGWEASDRRGSRRQQDE